MGTIEVTITTNIFVIDKENRKVLPNMLGESGVLLKEDNTGCIADFATAGQVYVPKGAYKIKNLGF
jgi:hypothetical protein